MAIQIRLNLKREKNKLTLTAPNGAAYVWAGRLTDDCAYEIVVNRAPELVNKALAFKTDGFLDFFNQDNVYKLSKSVTTSRYVRFNVAVYYGDYVENSNIFVLQFGDAIETSDIIEEPIPEDVTKLIVHSAISARVSDDESQYEYLTASGDVGYSLPILGGLKTPSIELRVIRRKNIFTWPGFPEEILTVNCDLQIKVTNLPEDTNGLYLLMRRRSKIRTKNKAEGGNDTVHKWSTIYGGEHAELNPWSEMCEMIDIRNLINRLDRHIPQWVHVLSSSAFIHPDDSQNPNAIIRGKESRFLLAGSTSKGIWNNSENLSKSVAMPFDIVLAKDVDFVRGQSTVIAKSNKMLLRVRPTVAFGQNSSSYDTYRQYYESGLIMPFPVGIADIGHI